MVTTIQPGTDVRSRQQTLRNVFCAASSTLHSGRTAVLSCAIALEELAARSAQPGAMHGLAFLLDQEYAARKLPHLVCFHHHDGSLAGAVLLLEYRIAGLNTGLVATGDSFGVRTVIGPATLRAQIAAEACAAMLTHGARIVLASFKQPYQHPTPLTLARATDCLWAMQTRAVQDHLPLAPTYDATLAQLGKRTRNHLRYYRRRLQNAMPCTFHADAAELIDRASLPLINSRSLKPQPQDTFDLQFHTAANSSGGFISGLRANDGTWLSLVGGWRQAGTTWIQWQSNAAGYEEHSLSTALRSFLIEQEISRGTRQLAFHGGTAHSMSHAFPVEQVVDLIARRASPLHAAVVRLLPHLYRLSPSLAHRGNFLADVLGSKHLRWFPEHVLPREFVRHFAAS